MSQIQNHFHDQRLDFSTDYRPLVRSTGRRYSLDHIAYPHRQGTKLIGLHSRMSEEQNRLQIWRHVPGSAVFAS